VLTTVKSAPEGAELSPDEVQAVIRTLPTIEWAKLRKIASAFGRACQVEPEDLLQRALLRTLEGKRRCPRNVAFIKFLAETMRSIASDWAKSRKRRPDNVESSPNLLLTGPVDDRPNQEERIIEEEEADQIRKTASRLRIEIPRLFQDDQQALTLIEGIMEGVEGEQLRAMTRCDKKSFASKRRLIRRRIERAFPGGWKA